MIASSEAFFDCLIVVYSLLLNKEMNLAKMRDVYEKSGDYWCGTLRLEYVRSID
ncbi:hypothetical protein GCM10019993_02860 [Enterococcus pseudoavium]